VVSVLIFPEVSVVVGLVVLDGVLLAVFDDLQLNIDTTKATVINTNIRFISYTF
jgi:hypothetical protein